MMYSPYATTGRFDCDPAYFKTYEDEHVDATHNYLILLEDSIKTIRESLGDPEVAMQRIELMKSELNALAYHVWHTYHTSGVVK